MGQKKGNQEKKERFGQEDVYNLIISDEVSWKSIIYDLINTEQLDPWDLDLILLTNKYMEKIKKLEQDSFFLSSKVLLAASLLLRIKSEILLNEHIKSIDEILFGKKQEEKSQEKIEMPEDLPELTPKTPLPRYKKVSLEDLMSSLNRAMTTEKRRIEKKVEQKKIEKETEIVLPKKKIDIKDRIRKIYARILTKFKKEKNKISYSELVGNKKEEKIACFLPCLHLENQEKLFLDQEKHFSEIYIWLYKHYKNLPKPRVKKAIEEAELEKETGFGNPLADFFTNNNLLK